MYNNNFFGKIKFNKKIWNTINFYRKISSLKEVFYLVQIIYLNLNYWVIFNQVKNNVMNIPSIKFSERNLINTAGKEGISLEVFEIR